MLWPEESILRSIYYWLWMIKTALYCIHLLFFQLVIYQNQQGKQADRRTRESRLTFQKALTIREHIALCQLSALASGREMAVLFWHEEKVHQGWRGSEASSSIILESWPQKCDKKLTFVELAMCMDCSKNFFCVNSFNHPSNPLCQALLLPWFYR